MSKCECGNCDDCGTDCFVAHYCAVIEFDENGKAFCSNPCPKRPVSEKELLEAEKRHQQFNNDLENILVPRKPTPNNDPCVRWVNYMPLTKNEGPDDNQ